MKANYLIAGTLGFLIACQPAEKPAEEMPPGLDVTKMDQSVDPKNDFYQFANGTWLNNTEIPGDEGRWGGFPELREKTNKNVLEIMNTAADNPEFEEGSDERKALNFFSVGMDSTHAERVGISPLGPWLEKIDAMDSQDQLPGLLAEMHRSGYGALHGVFVIADLKDSQVNSLYLGSGGLGLPNRDYYTKDDSASIAIREAYVNHVAKMMDMGASVENPETVAQKIMDLENELALNTLTPIEQRNIPALYNPMTVAQLAEKAPNFDWSVYLNKTGAENLDTIIVTEPKFMVKVSDIAANVEMETLRNYLKWNVINGSANYLNQEMVKANFDFYGKVISGTKEMRPRWKRVLSTTNGIIGEAIGKVYVAESFPPEAKAKAEEMVANLIKAFDQRIRNLPWMSEETQQQALKKLNTLTVKIGYPDEWKDYSDLQVASTGETYSYMDNIENARKYQFDKNMEKIGEDVDKKEWGMSPQTVNAYFNPLNNEIVFPAAILQPPFYNYTADAAVNYGGMGAVIGHEISHGFDDQGSRFDHEGNLVNWWTDEDKERFDALKDKLVAQFDSYEALPGLNVQGELTLGENIGDLGGLNAAYDALQIHLAENGRPGEIDGFTPEQRFFLSWATIWRTKYRDEYLRTQVMTDPHSPGMFRAVGPLVNMETFYEAFDVKEGDELYRAEKDRVKIW